MVGNLKRDGMLFVSAEQASLFLLLTLQASEDFFTFEQDYVTVSLVTPAMSRNVTLVKAKRQTLLIPADLTNTWEVVSTGPPNCHNTNTS